jgi:hypothetical protein
MPYNSTRNSSTLSDPSLPFAVRGTGERHYFLGLLYCAASMIVFVVLCVVSMMLIALGGEVGKQVSSSLAALFVLLGAGCALLMILFGVYPICARILERGRILMQPGLTEWARLGFPDPVLILRSFSDDGMVTLGSPFGFIQPRYEASLAAAAKRIAPPIILGSPSEPRVPLGAIRLYVAHEDWKSAVTHLMRRAALVFVVIGEGESLWWEIETAFATVQTGRLAFFFPTADHSKRLVVWPEGRIEEANARRQRRYRLFVDRIGLANAASLPQEIGNLQVIVQTESGSLLPLTNKYGYQGWYKGFSKGFLSIVTLGTSPFILRRYRGAAAMFDPDVEVSLRRTLRPYLDRIRNRDREAG